MEVAYKHSLTKDEAYNRLNSLLLDLQKKYLELSNANANWNPERTRMDFSANIKGYKLRGEVYLKDNQVTIRSELPLPARMFSKKIEHHLKITLENLLS